jgi:hypothetical protein
MRKEAREQNKPANNPVWNQAQNDAVTNEKDPERLDEAESGPNLSPIPISIHGSSESHRSTGS